MKNFKLIFMLAMLMFSEVLLAQNTVVKAVERYVIVNGQVASMKATVTPSLVKVSALIQKELPKGYTAESLVDKYLETQFVQDFASIISPYVMEKNVTAVEINELSDMLNSPEGKIATAHSVKFSSDETLADVMAILQKDVLAIATGNSYKKTNAKASAERSSLFMNFYKLSGTEKMISPIINALSHGNIPANLLEKMKAYFEDNLPVLMLNASEGVLTDDDLRFYQKLYEKPQYTKMIDGITEAISNSQQLGIQILTHYNSWIDNQ